MIIFCSIPYPLLSSTFSNVSNLKRCLLKWALSMTYILITHSNYFQYGIMWDNLLQISTRLVLISPDVTMSHSLWPTPIWNYVIHPLCSYNYDWLGFSWSLLMHVLICSQNYFHDHCDVDSCQYTPQAHGSIMNHELGIEKLESWTCKAFDEHIDNLIISNHNTIDFLRD